MKKIIIALFILFLFAKCNSTKTETKKEAEQAKTSVTQNPSDDVVFTSITGYYMKAKIDGKEWVANRIIHDEDAKTVTIIGDDNTTLINFLVPLEGLKAGDKIAFNDIHSATLSIEDKATFAGMQGAITITKIDNAVLEGGFYFTAITGAKKLQVTEGVFSIPLKGK